MPIRILSGITSGAIAISFAQPTDVVKVRMVSWAQTEFRLTSGFLLKFSSWVSTNPNHFSTAFPSCVWLRVASSAWLCRCNQVIGEHVPNHLSWARRARSLGGSTSEYGQKFCGECHRTGCLRYVQGSPDRPSAAERWPDLPLLSWFRRRFHGHSGRLADRRGENSCDERSWRILRYTMRQRVGIERRLLRFLQR